MMRKWILWYLLILGTVVLLASCVRFGDGLGDGGATASVGTSEVGVPLGTTVTGEESASLGGTTHEPETTAPEPVRPETDANGGVWTPWY